jgi:hypothetical protein
MSLPTTTGCTESMRLRHAGASLNIRLRQGIPILASTLVNASHVMSLSTATSLNTMQLATSALMPLEESS